MNSPTRRDRRPRVIGYARLSKNPDGTLTSVEDQKKIMADYADRNGLELVTVYSDDNRSAWRTDRPRKGWEAFLTALAEPDADLDGALSYHFDRLARNGRDGERFLAVMELRGLSLWTPQTVMDLGANADARMVFRMLVAVAINQSDATSRRARDHKDVARDNGRLRYVLGSNPPLGLCNASDDASDWTTEPAAAAALRDIAARVLRDPQHRLPQAVADSLPLFYATGERASLAAIRAALKRPATAGLMTDRDGEIISYDPVIADPPLDVVTWRRLRAMFAPRRVGTRPADDGARYPFAAFLRCGLCGNQLTGGQNYYRRPTGEVREDGSRVYRVQSQTAVYGCRTAHKRLGIAKPCKRVSVPAEDANAVLRAALDEWTRANPDYLAARDRAQASADTREADIRAALLIARDDLADVMAERRRLGARYATVKADAAAEVDRLESELDALAAAPVADRLPERVDWQAMTPAEVRALATEALDGPVTVAPGRVGSREDRSALGRMTVNVR